jgi:type IX secretion system PorP/SprF family membrane protein
MNDRTGPTSFTGGTVTAAYHISFEKLNPFKWPLFLRQSKIAVGLSASVYQYRLNSNDLQLDQPNDPAINSVQNQKWSPNAGLGIYYYYDKFFLGFSIPNVIPLDVQFDQGATESNLKRALHYYVVVGGKIPLGSKNAYQPKFFLEPMVWFRTVKGAPFQVDGHLRFRYKNLFWIGAGYRSMKTVVADAGVMIKNHFSISYAYDQSLLDVRSYIGSTHEIVLAYQFDNKKKTYRHNH